MMHNQYDILFLMERARRHGYELVLNEVSKTNPERSLYFGPSKTKREGPNYKLVWGKTLSSFKPKLSTASRSETSRSGMGPAQQSRPLKRPQLEGLVTPARNNRLSLISHAFDRPHRRHHESTGAHQGGGKAESDSTFSAASSREE